MVPMSQQGTALSCNGLGCVTSSVVYLGSQQQIITESYFLLSSVVDVYKIK